jgi:hypothetical protein
VSASFLVAYVPLNGWLVKLAEGWRFPGMIVEPMQGHHGFWSVLMERDDDA